MWKPKNKAKPPWLFGIGNNDDKLWKYSNLSGRSCYLDLKANSCYWFARNCVAVRREIKQSDLESWRVNFIIMETTENKDKEEGCKSPEVKSLGLNAWKLLS